MNSEAVASGETLITYMALVASGKPPLVSHGRPMKNIKWYVWRREQTKTSFPPAFHLMLSFMVKFHGAQGATGEAAASNVTVKGWLTAMGIEVFAQVNQILTPWRETKKWLKWVMKCKLLMLYVWLLSSRGFDTCIRNSRRCTASRYCAGI